MNRNKIIVAVAVLSALMLTLAACGGTRDAEPTRTTATTAEQQTTAAPETTVQEITTVQETTTAQETIAAPQTALSAGEIRDLLVEANDFYWEWVSHGPKLDWTGDYQSRAVIVNGNRYYPVPDSPFASVAAVKEKAGQYFTPDVYESRIDDMFADYDGRLYAAEGSGQGGDVAPVGYRLEILSQTEDSCRFELVSLYEFSEPYTHSYELLRQDGRWVFTADFTEAIIVPDAEWTF